MVNLKDESINISSLDTFDPSRSHANIEINNAEAKELIADGWLEIEKILDQSAVLFSFEQIGGAEAAMNMAKDYAQGRYAFGRSIASFQAIKHKIADMYISLQLQDLIVILEHGLFQMKLQSCPPLLRPQELVQLKRFTNVLKRIFKLTGEWVQLGNLIVICFIEDLDN